MPELLSVKGEGQSKRSFLCHIIFVFYEIFVYLYYYPFFLNINLEKVET